MTTDLAPVAPEVNVCGEARLTHDGWVSEFEAFQWSGDDRNGGASNAVAGSARSGRSGLSAAARCGSSEKAGGDPTKAMDNLRAEIKLLHWHKLANEAALKAALLKTKKIKAQGGGTTKPVPAMTTLAMPTEERAAWMQQVIEEEQSKPLQVTKDFMSKYEEQEKENEGRLDTEVAAHIRSLRILRKQIEKRGEMKARRTKYRAAQKQLDIEKQQLLLGQLHERDGGHVSAPQESKTKAGTRCQPASGQVVQKTVDTLGTVLGSLDKLVELEKRITSLEKSNVYDKFRGTKQEGVEPTITNTSSSMGGRRTFPSPGGSAASNRRGVGRPGAGARNRRLSFSKQKTEATIESPSQVYYSVRMHRKATGKDRTARNIGDGSKSSGRAGYGVRSGVQSNRTRGGASTFLTQLPDVHRHTRGMMGPGPSSEGGGFHSAIAEKKRLDAKRKVAGGRAEALRIARQDRIIREWLERKKTAATAGNRQRRSSYVLPGLRSTSLAGGRVMQRVGGASATRGGVNMHLQEFRDIRAQYAKRTEKLRRDLSRRQKGAQGGVFLAGTRTVAVARPKPAPVRMPRPRPGLVRGRDVRRAPAATIRRGEATTRGGRGERVQQAGLGGGLAVGGTGLRVVRGRQQRKPLSLDGIGSTQGRESRTSRSRPHCAVAVLPRVRGTGVE